MFIKFIFLDRKTHTAVNFLFQNKKNSFEILKKEFFCPDLHDTAHRLFCSYYFEEKNHGRSIKKLCDVFVAI